MTCRGALILIVAVLLAAVSPADEYVVGGDQILRPELKQALDERRLEIRLGINTDRLRDAGIKPDPFVEGILILSEAVRQNVMPGVIVSLNSLWGDVLPIGVGSMSLEPEKAEADWSTYYELGEVAGVVAVMPQVLRLVGRGELDLERPVGVYLEWLRGTRLGDMPVELYLRQATGLPASWELPNDVRTREQLLEWIAAMEPAHVGRVAPSGLNWLVLGLLVEDITETPVQKLLTAGFLGSMGMANTVSDIPDHLRSQSAPQHHSAWHGRMVWGEAMEPTAFILGESAGHGGLISSADDLGLYAKLLLATYSLGLPDYYTSETLQQSTRPSVGFEGGANQGLGWMLNGFGEGSFGWEGPEGCAFWVHPQSQMYLIILGNAHHPNGRHEGYDRALRLARQCFLRALPETPKQAAAGCPCGCGERGEPCVRLALPQCPDSGREDVSLAGLQSSCDVGDGDGL